MYVAVQVLINLALIALGIYLFTKETDSKDDEGKQVTGHKYRIVGIVLIVLVVLGSISSFMPKG